jgi:hypothetical protein
MPRIDLPYFRDLSLKLVRICAARPGRRQSQLGGINVSVIGCHFPRISLEVEQQL